MKDKSFYNKLKKLRIEILYLNSYQDIFLLVILATLISLFYKSEFGNPGYKPYAYELWLPYSIAAYLFKFLCTVAYRKKFYRPDNDRLWQYVFYFNITLTGLSIGLSSLFVTTMSNEIEKIFIILLISAMSSGSVSVLSTSMTSFIIYNSLSLIPYIYYYLVSSASGFSIVGYLILLFLLTISLTFLRTYIILNRSLSLKIENDLIIEKLRLTEDKFAKSFYSGVAPMAMIDYNNAKIIDVNNAMLNLTEYSRDELIGRNPYDFNLTEHLEDFIDTVIETAKNGHIFNRNIAMVTKSGIIKKCLATIETFKVNKNIIAFFMLQDFTERLEYEKNLKYERDRAEEAAKAKATFLASMTHEIRTPMNSILGMTSLAIMSDNASEKNEYLNTVKDSAEYLLTLINDILDFSKIEAGKVEIDLIDASLPKLLNSVYRMMELPAQNRKLNFTIESENTIPEFIRCSPERLTQILINLIGNAIKFTIKGSVTVNVRMSGGSGYSHTSASKEFIEFSITDTGIGIPEDKHEEIFKSFTQANSSTFRKFGGTGLGLSISRQLIKLMEGDIKVISKPDKGSTFSFIIPFIRGARPAGEDMGAVTESRHTNVKRVLIAEDNVLNQKLISAYMKKLNHEYSIAENGFATIELLKNNFYDLVLMDLEMPLMDGYETMKMIRSGEAGESNRNIIIHAMSAHVMKTTIERCLAEGFNGYITKPVDLKKLTDILG